MREKIFTSLAIITVMAQLACTTNTREATADASARGAAESQPAPEKQQEEKMPEAIVRESFDAFVSDYKSGDMEAAASRFDEDAIWYLSDGSAITSSASIEAFLARAREGGAGRFSFSEVSAKKVASAYYSTATFSFELSPGERVVGTRYSVWSAGDEPVILRDAWVADAPASEELTQTIAQNTRALSAATNGDSLNALLEVYASDASMVLSNGVVIPSAKMREMLEGVAQMKIEDMRFGPQRVYAAGASHAYSVGAFDLTLPTAEGDVPIAGERVILWRRVGDRYQAVLELSWPRAM